MPGDMSLKLDGIKGENPDEKHKDEIQIMSFSFGATQEGSAHVGTGLGSGKAHFSDITFVKLADKSSPVLFKKCITGEHIKDAVLSVHKAGGTQLLYYQVTLEECMVSGIQTSSGDGGTIVETVSLNFTKVKVDYTPQTAKGAGEAKITAGYDLKAQKAS